MKGVYTKEITMVIDENMQWHVDDSNNTVKAICNSDIGNLIQASAVISAMPAFGTFGSKGAVLVSFFKEAAKLSLNITDDDIE